MLCHVDVATHCTYVYLRTSQRENAIRRRMYAENPGAAADPDAAYFKSEGVAKKVKWMPSLD